MICTTLAISFLHSPLPASRCPLILGLGFVTPAFFVAGILLASIPIIIHILNRRRYKTVNWAAMEFLLRAMKKNRRRLKFEQWLLLATRCLVLLLVATALARPMGCRDSTLASLAGQRAGLHVIVIDNSYSMAYEANRPDAPTHLDHAKLLAKKLIDTFQAGSESVAVVTASRPASAVLSAPTYDLQAARDAVDRIGQSFGGTDLLGALRLAKEIGQKERTAGRKNLYLISDGTRSAWESSESGALKQLGPQLAQEFHITSYNLGRRDQWNQATLEVKPASNLVTNRLSSDLLATVQSFGMGPEALLQWKLDGQVLPGGGNVRFKGEEPQTLPQSSAIFRAGGAHVITASLVGDDRLKLDNTRSRVIDVASNLKVLIVEGERGMSKLGGSGAFLDLALAPPSENNATSRPAGAEDSNATDSYVRPELISDLELGNKVLNDYRAVILAGVGQISSNEADQLVLFVKNGGALIIFMGEPVSADNYNQMLLSRGLLPGPLTRRVSAANNQSGFLLDFDPENVKPLLSAFRHQANSGLGTAQIFTYWQMDVKPNSGAERVLNYLPSGASSTRPSTASSQEDPAITLHALGQGHVLVCTTTANAEWTSLPAKPAYVALMHEILDGTVSSGDRWMNLSVGDRLIVPPNINFASNPTLSDPQQNQVVLEPISAGGNGSYRSGPLARPGIYHLNTGTATLPIAVNVPADEADVRTITNEAIKKDLGGVDIDLEGDMVPAAALEANKTGNDFGWPLMLAGLLFVACECLMAMRFGHYRR
jgi:Mg-chelatase subunit ChlD